MLLEPCSTIGIGDAWMMRRSAWSFVLVGAVLLSSHVVQAAIGCTLSNPPEDLKYLYPDMTTYKEDLKEFTRLPNGDGLFQALRHRLKGDLDPLYETYDTPYTIYSVFRGEEKIGIVHGVNVPGAGGVIQVFLSMDPKSATIRKFFFQRLESPIATHLRNKAFRDQFSGFTLADFYKHDYYAVADPGAAADKVGKITPPPMGATDPRDYHAALRGIRKNLILLDFFVYGRRFDPFFDKAQSALAPGTKTKTKTEDKE